MRTLFKLIFWFTMWIPTYAITVWFKKKGQENCMTWAVDKFENEGGYLVVRWCRSARHDWLRWPHFLYLPADQHHVLQHVIPVDCSRLEKKHIPEPWFDPQRVQGDDVTDCYKEN